MSTNFQEMVSNFALFPELATKWKRPIASKREHLQTEKKLLKYANWPEGNPLPVCKSVLRGRTLVPLPQRVYRRRFYLIKRQYLPFRVSRSQKNGQTFRFGPSSLTNQLAFVKKFDGWSSAEGIFLTLREKK